MNKHEFIDSLVKIGDIHAMRMGLSLLEVRPLLPIKEEDLLVFTNDQFAQLEMIVNRFAKLQDMIGSKLFPLVLELHTMESAENKPMRDILDALEKKEILSSAQWWMDMREIRNHVAHEYPDNPELMCKNLNDAIIAAGELLEYWTFLKGIIKRLEK